MIIISSAVTVLLQPVALDIRKARLYARVICSSPDIQEAIEDQQMVMRFEAGVSRADLALLADEMFYRARTVRDQGRAIDIMAKLYGLYH